MTDQDHVDRYPLEWPLGWKRTPRHLRRTVPFKAQNVPGSRPSEIGHARALQRLESELDRLGATNVTLSTNLELRLDGRPRATDQRIEDPGVAVYFRFKKRPTVLACDAYLTVPGNIAAIAGHIEALRRIERYGVGTIEQALAGYKSLPADTAADWRQVFGFDKNSQPSIDQLKDKHKALAREHHPDRGGSEEKMMQLNRAREYALEELNAS